jgi:hypothetical protein
MDLTIPTILYLLSHAILNDFPPFMDYHLTGEIEEQLHILEDLSPDWISKKVIPGGDILYRLVLHDLYRASANMCFVFISKYHSIYNHYTILFSGHVI